jgi:hypothetical protein
MAVNDNAMVQYGAMQGNSNREAGFVDRQGDRKNKLKK